MKAVINSTPLISLAIIDRLSLLDELFEGIYISEYLYDNALLLAKEKK